jgi:hypothetical protein
MYLYTNKYFFTTNKQPGLARAFWLLGNFSKRPQVFRSGVDALLVGLSELTTGALLA